VNKKFLFFSVLMVLVLSLSACVSVGSPDLARSVTVTGAGQIGLKPDIAYIYIGVTTEDPSAADAVARNNADSQRLIDALKAQGVAADDIRTSNFSIWTNRPYGFEGQAGDPVYVVDNTVNVTVRDLDNLGSLLDVAVRSGANNINSIQFDLADKTEAMSQARAAAVEAARKQAEELAVAAGVTLGKVQTITFYDSVPYPVYENKGLGGAEAMDMSVPINPGTMQLTVTVTIAYEIK
jgi:uncharacterized protein